jgi:KaiC/GvpD/RAD55 family RecA-like ATPase
MEYSLPESLPMDAIPPGTSLLIAGPSLTRKRELMLRLVDQQTDEGTAVITTKKSAGTVMQQLDIPPESEGREYLRLIDCVTQQRGMGESEETETTKYISSPRDLTGLSIKLSGVFQNLYQQDVPTRVGLDSLSTFLMYHDLQRVYRMMHVLSGQIESAGWLGTFVIDSPSDRELEVLTQLVDGMIQTRDTDAGYEFRVRGFDRVNTEWTSY